MKRILSILLIIVMLISLVACESTARNNITSNGNDNNTTINNSNDTEGKYHISKANAWILVPQEYAFFTRDMDAASQELKERGISKSELVNYLDAYGSEFVAITPNGNMEVMLKFKETGFSANDLSSQNKSTISSYAEGLQLGFSADSYELVECNGVVWVKLEYSHYVLGNSNPADYVRYTTIANGWDINLWGASYEGKLTSQDKQEMQTMLNSFFINK